MASDDISDFLTYESSLKLEYAEEFKADLYEGGYYLLTIGDESRYLLVPEGKQAPDDLDRDIVVINQPLNDIYLVNSAAMSSFVDLGAIDMVSFTGTRKNDWYIEEAAAAMADGSILYAGKYSAPDYELLLDKGCDLCIENTMIYHTPEVKENLEKFGIPVLVDYSSYESQPLGRCEWIKLYGILTGSMDKAQKIYDQQAAYIDEVTSKLDDDGERPTVAYFYISSSGGAVVRRSNDYIPKMIELAGGSYIFSDLGTDDGSAASSINMNMEKFYESACDADYIIYNSTVDGEIRNISELTVKAPILAEFKAVKEGNVYCTGKNFYQETNVCGIMVSDIYNMLKGEDDDLFFLQKVI